MCGAGAMGLGIAQVAAQAGVAVTVFDVAEAALSAARGRLDATLERSMATGRVSRDEALAVRSRLTWSADLAAAAGSDLVVEAIPAAKVCPLVELIAGTGSRPHLKKVCPLVEKIRPGGDCKTVGLPAATRAVRPSRSAGR